MDDSGHRENGRHKPEMYKSPQSQWLMQQPQSMKHIISIIAERDAAIQERNMAINEKNKALEERDMAIMQRDAAILGRNEAIMERDNALGALHFRQNSTNSNNSFPPGGEISRGVKYPHHTSQCSHVGEASYDGRESQVPEALLMSSPSPDTTKSHSKAKRAKEPNAVSPNKKPKPRNVKIKEGGALNSLMFSKSQEWRGMQEDLCGNDDDYKHLSGSKPDWKGPDLGLNDVAFDDSTMPPPVCSCTGIYRQCYKWGNGGWQSSCCTTTVSMYPLPSVPNKRHARVGGRKMSGSAFSKLLSRVAANGHDLSTPVDLKDNWAKHGTNRYITIK